MAQKRWADDDGQAEVKREHKRRVPDTDPPGVYSGMLARVAITDGTFFPECERPSKKVLPKGQKRKGY